MKKLTCSSLLVLLLTCIPHGAEAARFRLHMDTSVFHFKMNTYDFSEGEYEDKVRVTSFGFGDGGAPLGENFIELSSMFSLGFGLVFIEHLTVGLKLGLGGGRAIYKEEEDGEEEYEEKYTVFGYSFMPYVEYKFDTGAVQPFVLFTLGYRGSVLGLDDDEEKILTHFLDFGGGGGIHIFITDSFSFDAGLLASGLFGRLVLKSTYDDGSGSMVEQKEKYPGRGFKINVLLGLSGWF